MTDFHDTGTLGVCRAYCGYSDLLKQLPDDIGYSDTQAAQIRALVEAVLESEPHDLKELAAKITTLERVYEGSEAIVPFEIIAKDIRRLAGED